MTHAGSGSGPRPDDARWRERSGDLAATVFQTTAALIVILDRQGRVVQFNAACERLSGYREAEVLGRELLPLVLPPEQRDRVQDVFRDIVAGQFPNHHENEWMTRDGERRTVLWSNSATVDAAGHVECVISTGLDVTEYRFAQRSGQDTRDTFRFLFDQCADGTVLIDPNDPDVPWRIVDCNAAYGAMNGYERHELVGQPIDVLHTEALAPEPGGSALEGLRQGGVFRGEYLHRRRDGSTYTVEATSSLIRLDGRELVLGIDRDVTERRAADEIQRELSQQLAHAAHHDSLTGLPNRALLLDRLGRELGRGRRAGHGLAVMFIDLDDFKRVNDSLGHDAGDELLVEVARRLVDGVRPGDTVARLGGDEFVVLLPDVMTADHAQRVAQRLLASLGRPVVAGGQEVCVECSIGIAAVDGPGVTAETVLRQADLAMYRLKKEGKNGIGVFTPELDHAAHERMQLEIRLRRAVTQGRLSAHYQPQFDAVTGELVGLEALARWTDEDLGPVPPGVFIPVAEDCGLIGALGGWMLDEVCRQIRAWDLGVPVSVNVSPAQVLRPDFPDTVRGALARHGLPGRALTLELTERLAVRDPALAARRMRDLADLGVQLSLDDFGSGHGAVTSLLELPLSELKIDRSLTAALTAEPATWRVVRALLGLAHGLGLTVVAEGVETEEQLAALRSIGCDRIQGYLTGRPVPSGDVRWHLPAG